MLIVADNARDAGQVRPLLPGAPGCLAVVTSRSRLAGLITADGARCIDLDVLTVGECHELLAARVGARRVAGEPWAVAEIIDRCGQLPLALAIVAARAAAHPDFTLAALAAELRDSAHGRLDALDGGEPATGVRAVFSWSYQQLDDAAARLFRLLGLHSGPDITVAAAASLAGRPARQTRQALALLADLHLIAEHTPGRYALHDLLREFAAELARTLDPQAERQLATGRVLDHYLRTAHEATLLLSYEPIHGPVTLPGPCPGAEPELLADAVAAQAWFTAERPVLLAAISHAAATGWDVHAWQLSWAVRDYLARHGYFQDLLATQQTALESARRLGDRRAEARARSGLGSACGWLGRHDEATGHLRHALELFAGLGDMVNQAEIYLDLGWVLSNQGRDAGALGHAERALALFRAAGDRNGEASTLNNIGWAHAQGGDYRRAVAYCEQSIALHQELGDRLSEARAVDSLGFALLHLGRPREAVACYQRAIDLNRQQGDPLSEACALDVLGDTYQATGQRAAARAAWQQAVDIFGQLAQPEKSGPVLAKIRALDRGGQRVARPL
jgi:tetratricopeptide (TPR) repeat protein